MALFKILNNFTSGTQISNVLNHVQGYCYFDKNTNKFYIDTTNAASGLRQLNGSYYGVCSTAGNVGTKLVDIPGFALVEGAAVYIRFVNANTAQPSTLELNVSGTGAIAISKSGTLNLNSSDDIEAGSICQFLYNGSRWIWVGHLNTDQIYVFADGYNEVTNPGATVKTVNDALANWQVDFATTSNYATTAQYAATAAPSINGVYYGVCDTAQGTKAKTVTLTNGTNFELATGCMVAIKFTNASAASTMTLNVNGTGAKNLCLYGTSAMSSTTNTNGWRAGAVVMFVFDGSQWERVFWENTTYYYTSIYCTTGASTAAKTASISGAQELTAGKYFQIWIQNSNTAQSKLTLNISEKGAKDVYINGTISSTTNYTLPRGCYIVYYDGTNYYFRTDNLLTASITGNAETSNFASSANFAASADYATSSSYADTTGTASYAINAASATYATSAELAAKADAFSSNKAVTLTGDVTGTASSTAGWSIATTLSDITTTATTSTASPSHNGTFTVVDNVTVDSKGRVTKVNTKTVTLPNDEDTKYYAGAGLSLSGTTFNIAQQGVTNAMLAGSIENSKLSHSSIDIAGNNVSLGGTLTAATLRTSLGLSSAIHFLGKATVTITDGSTTDPKVGGVATTVDAGDVVIDKDSAYEYIWDGSKWERLGPDGSYVISGSTVTYTPAGTIPSHTYQPAGTVSQPTFVGDATTISMSGNTTGVKVSAHSFTPQGSISSATTSTNANYTPTGIVSQPTFTGTSATVKVNGTPQGGVVISATANANGNYTPAGSIQAIGFTGTTATITVSGTPQGSITVSTTTGTSGTNYTPTGTNASSTVTITPSTTTVYSMSNNGAVTAGSAASFTQGTDSFTANSPTVIDTTKFSGGSYSHSGFNGGTQATASMSVANGVLTFSFTPNNTATYGTDTFTAASINSGFYTPGTSASFTQGSDSFVANTPTSVTLPSRTSATVWNGYTAASAAGQTFTGVATKISAEFSGSTSTASCKYQPAGTVSTPEFFGEKVQLDAVFTGTSTTFSGSYKPAGTVSQPIFDGDPAKFTFTGSAETLSHTVTQGSVDLSTQYQPTGTVSQPTFTGTTATLTHTFNGTTATITLP